MILSHDAPALAWRPTVEAILERRRAPLSDKDAVEEQRISRPIRAPRSDRRARTLVDGFRFSTKGHFARRCLLTADKQLLGSLWQLPSWLAWWVDPCPQIQKILSSRPLKNPSLPLGPFSSYPPRLRLNPPSSLASQFYGGHQQQAATSLISEDAAKEVAKWDEKAYSEVCGPGQHRV